MNSKLKKSESKKSSTSIISLVAGNGEVGKSLAQVLRRKYTVRTFDARKLFITTDDVEVLHICFPYSDSFVTEVKRYQKDYEPKFTVIHSTVPIGTSKKCKAFHSPIRGIHPKMVASLGTFTKYLAPHDDWLEEYFLNCGLPVETVDNSNNTEALKLWSTTYYGWNIIFEKILHKFCKDNKLDYDIVYTRANITYNEGYNDMGMGNVTRPVLVHSKGDIGGHCVIPNLDLFDSAINDFIKKYNKRFKVSKMQTLTSKVRRTSRGTQN